MSLFDTEFFPTPKNIVQRMLEPYANRIAKATILEPSAGSGSILEVLEEGVPYTFETASGHKYQTTVKANPEKLFCIEKNPELQMILQEKQFHLVADDFLNYQPEISYDLIVLNPPFSCGDKHLLHAWEILRSGDIACLLNAETIRNPYSASRKLLAKIIESNGTVEELGKCFRGADNSTDVDVVLVRLHKEEKEETFKLDLDGFANEVMPDFGELASSGDSLMQSSRLDAFLRAWEMAKAAAVNYIKAREMLQLYMGAFISDNASRGESVIRELEKYLDDSKNSYKGDSEKHIKDGYNHFVGKAKQQAWDMIFNQIGLGKYMTSRLSEKLHNYQNAQASFGLTKDNIMKLFSFIMLNINSIMDEAVVEVYDIFTRYHKDNTSWTEGWKTNKQFRCNRKVILPNVANAGFMPERYGYSKTFSPEYSAVNRLKDIDKAMCWLSGRNYDSLTGEIDIPGQGKSYCPENSTINQALSRIEVGDQGWHDSAFFRIKAFKKGTIHLEFKEEALWAKFNLTVNQGKNQLGNNEAA